MANEMSNTFWVGKTKCVLTWSQDGGLNAVWDPGLPRKFSKAEEKQYYAGRATLIQEIANTLGVRVAVMGTAKDDPIQVFDGEKE